MITVEQYWMGREREFAADLTPEVTENAHFLVERVNLVLARAALEHVFPAADLRTGHPIASGWRPKAVNNAGGTANRTSKHIIGCAIDLRDRLPDRPLARWCLRNRHVLEEAGLWMPDPRWTPSWIHLQSVPPASGERIYLPAGGAALAEPLPEQRTIPGG